jgi:hypothetical protein
VRTATPLPQAIPLARVKSTLGPGTMMIAREARVKPMRCEVGIVKEIESSAAAPLEVWLPTI